MRNTLALLRRKKNGGGVKRQYTDDLPLSTPNRTAAHVMRSALEIYQRYFTLLVRGPQPCRASASFVRDHRSEKLHRRPEVAQIIAQSRLFLCRHFESRNSRAPDAMAEDRFAFLGHDLGVGPRHKSQRHQVMAEGFKDALKPFRGPPSWFCACGCASCPARLPGFGDSSIKGNHGGAAPIRWRFGIPAQPASTHALKKDRIFRGGLY